MTITSGHKRRRRRAGAVAVLALAVGLVAGCATVPGTPEAAEFGASSSPSGQSSGDASVLEAETGLADNPIPSGDDDFGSGDDDVGEDALGGVQQGPDSVIEWQIPAEPVDEPDGWKRSVVSCADPDTAGGSYISFAVPAQWRLRGQSGGSNDVARLNFGFTYDNAGGSDIQIKIESDDDTLVEDFDIGHTFDYDYALGDDEVRIVFDSLGTVPIGEQQAELFVAKREQAPRHLERTEYKVRVHEVDVPMPAAGGLWDMWSHSFVMSIRYDPRQGDLDEDTVREIVSSLAVPECSVDGLVATSESMYEADLNGDGYVSDLDDYEEFLMPPN